MSKKERYRKPKPVQIELTHSSLRLLAEVAMRQAAEKGITVQVIPRGVSGPVIDKRWKHKHKAPKPKAKPVTLSSVRETSDRSIAEKPAKRSQGSQLVSS